ncbi:TadE/TadG family type IV pilus assembly protein [Chloroflexota bacterium]
MEHAILLPLLLLLFLGIVEFAIVIFAYDTIANAAREGARAGIVHRATEYKVMEAAEAAVLDRALALGLTSDNVTVTLTLSHTVRVEVNYIVTLMTGPVIGAVGGNPNVRLHTVATMNRE